MGNGLVAKLLMQNNSETLKFVFASEVTLSGCEEVVIVTMKTCKVAEGFCMAASVPAFTNLTASAVIDNRILEALANRKS